MKTSRRLATFVLGAMLFGGSSQALAARVSVTVAPYFTNNMVLQRDLPVPVWGTAPSGTEVTGSFRGQSFPRTQAINGKWMVRLGPMSASSTPGDLIINVGSTPFTYINVVVGDVWVLSGQSNINVKLRDCNSDPDAISTSGDYSNTIRLYLVPQTGGLTEQWEQSNSTNTPDWSCIGFFFARALYNLHVDHQESYHLTPVPIGLIQAAKNGTPIADWTTYGGSNNGRLYKDKIRPLQPFAIRGVIWYQGEDDGSQESSALKYYEMLPKLIENWRQDWGLGAFPFLYVQLALISGRPTWAILRDAQVSTLDVTTNTAMACIIDVATMPVSEIHPRDKEPAGERLALAAFAERYAQIPTVYSGPIRDKMKSSISGNKIVIGFNHLDEGLVTDNGNLPGPFLIAGADGIYYPATAQIVSPAPQNPEILEDMVVVSSPSVSNPKSVRYCWGSYPICNLFNKHRDRYRLPASPFQLKVQ